MNKTISLYNPDAMVCVEIVDMRPEKNLVWKPFKKSFWGNRKEGFYEKHFSTCWTKEDIESGKYFETKGLKVIDNIVYYPPYVRTVYMGDQKTIAEFDTYEKALKYGTDMAKQGNCQIKLIHA